MNQRIVVAIVLVVMLAACVPAAPTASPVVASPTGPPATQVRSTPSPITNSATAPPTQVSTPVPSATSALLLEDGFLLERVAQTGGSIYGVALGGDTAYVGMGPRLAEIDISQPEQPILLRQSEPLPGLVSQVLLISEDTLLINAGKFLVAMNASPRAELRPIAQLELEGEISALVWDDQERIVYTGQTIFQRSSHYTGLISAVKLAPDNHFSLLNSVTMPEWPMSIALSSQGLYAGAEGDLGGLYYIQVSTPGELSTPSQVIASVPEEPLQPFSMRVIGERLYLCYRDIQAYDINDPEHPLKIWSVSSGGDVVAGFSFMGDKVYYFGWTILSEYVQDVANLPEAIPGQPVGVTVSITAIAQGNFLVAYNDLEIYATADAPPLPLLGTYQAPVIHAMDAAANEQAVYVVDSGLGASNSTTTLRVFSLPELTPLGQVNTELSSWYDYVGVALQGDRLYLAEMDALWLYDVSNSRLNLLGRMDMDQGEITAISAMQSGDQRFLVAAQVAEDYSSVVSVYDVTDWQNPVSLGDPVILDQGDAEQIIGKDTWLYVRLDGSYHSDFDTLYKLNFDGYTLELQESLMLANNTHHLAVGEYSLAVAGTHGFLGQDFLSMLDPQTLKEVSQTNYPDYGVGLSLIGDMTWIVVGHGYGAAQLLIFDVSDPVHPQQIEVMDIAQSDNFTVPIIETGSFQIIANGAGGVEVLKYTR